MTKQEWLECNDPLIMLKFLLEKASDRKLRLFACGVFRRTFEKYPNEPSYQGHLRVLEVAERYSDGLVTEIELALSRELPEAKGYAMQFCLSGFSSKEVLVFTRTLSAFSIENPEFLCRSQAKLLHDIFGYPFHPIILAPSCLTPKVVNLAQEIYDNRAFDCLPLLADALEESGCNNAEILAHCRGAGPHVRGCWVVDLLLGRG